MSLRSAAALLVLALLLGGVGGLFAVWERPGPVESNRIFPGAWREVRQVRIARGGLPPSELIELQPDAGGRWRYRLNQGPEDDLDPQALEEIKALVTLAQYEAAPESAEPVDFAGASQIALVDGQGGESVVYLAPPGDGGAGRRVALKNRPGETLLLPAELLRIVDRPAAAFRNLDLFDFTGGRAPLRVALDPGRARGRQEPVVLQRGERQRWEVIRPVRWPADPEARESLLRMMRDLRAQEVMAEAAENFDVFSLGEDAASITLAVAGREGKVAEQTVYFSPPTDGLDVVYARVADRRPVFRVAADLARRLQAGQGEAARRANDWADAYRQRSIGVIAGPNQPPPAVSVTAPDGRRLVLLQEAPAAELVAAAKQAGAPPPAPRWTAEIRGGDGALLERFPADPLYAGQLLATLAWMPVADFLPPPADPEAHDAGRPVWRVAAHDAAGRETVAARLMEFPGALSPAPFPEGWVGPPNPERSPAFEARLEGYDERARIGEGVSGYVCRPFFHYRDRALAKLAYDEVGWVRIERDGEARVYAKRSNKQWRRIAPTERPVTDDQYVLAQSVMGALYAEAVGYVAAGEEEGAPDKYGLAAPRARITMGAGAAPVEGRAPLLDLRLGNAPEHWGFHRVATPEGELFELVCGGAAAGRGVEKPRAGEAAPWYAVRAGQPPVLLLYGEWVDRLLGEMR